MHTHGGTVCVDFSSSDYSSKEARLLAYLISHNHEHEQDLKECRDALEQSGNTEAVSFLNESLNDIDSAISKMQKALNLLETK